MDFDPVIENLPRLFGGFVLTLELTAISLVWGMALAVPLALLRVSRKPLLWMPVYGYIFFLRGTPLLIQIYLIYYGLGQIGWIKTTFLWTFFREAYWCALLAFSLNTSAYTAEILRGAILAVPHGEIEAAKACGMSRMLAFRRIILPRAFQLMLPAYSNEVILMLQATSLASIVTLLDLTGVGDSCGALVRSSLLHISFARAHRIGNSAPENHKIASNCRYTDFHLHRAHLPRAGARGA